MLRSLLDDYRLGGKLPRWAEQNYDAAHMSGDPAIPMIADGYCRGLVAPGDAGALRRGGQTSGPAQPRPLAHGYGYLADDNAARPRSSTGSPTSRWR